MILTAEVSEMNGQQSEIDLEKQNLRKKKRKSKCHDTEVQDKPKRKRKHEEAICAARGTKNRKMGEVILNRNSDLKDVKRTECSQEEIQESHNDYMDIQTQVSDSGHKGTLDKKISDDENKMFNGKFFRKSFASGVGLDNLKKFVMICKENKDKDLAAEYLNAGGSILEVLRLIDTSEKKSLSNIVTVFSAINILLMKILAQYPQYQSSAGEACRHLINSHLAPIHVMLSVKSDFKKRKVVLKLLAAMVSLGGNNPRELLAHLNIQTDALEYLIKHTKPTDDQSVRTCYIYFVLAFLVEGNTTVIRSFLEKSKLLSSIFPNLMYDSQKIVNLVLTTIKTYVLENPGISKTLKLSVFSIPVVLDIVALYNWKGPKNWKKEDNYAHLTSAEFLEEKEIVTSIVHDFLITLLTSHRHGIIFHDYSLGTSGQRHNRLIHSILLSLDRAWEHERPADLVVKILSACPDLIRSQFNSIAPYLEPRVSRKWVQAVEFVRKIIETANEVAYFQNLSPAMSVFQIVSATVSLTLPPAILANAIRPALENPHVVVRHEAICTLVIMFRKLKKFYGAVNTYCGHFINFPTFKNIAMSYIVKHVPVLETLLQVWAEAFKADKDRESFSIAQDLKEPTKVEHLLSVLDLLHLYREICPEILDVPTKIELNSLLKGIEELESYDDGELSVMKVKAIQFLLIIDSSKFMPQKETFGPVLTFLVNLLDKNSSKTSADLMNTLKMLLSLSGVFEGCLDQIDIWIHSFLNATTSSDKSEVVSWFVESVKSAVKHTHKYTSLIGKAEECSGENIANSTRIECIFDELSKDFESIDDLAYVWKTRMQPTVSIPVILPSALKKVRNNPSPVLLRHTAYILVYTLHCQVLPGPLLKLTEDVEHLPPHLASWIINKPTHIKKIFPSMEIVWTLSKALTEDSELTSTEIFHAESNLCEFEALTAFRLVVFYLTQFAQREILSKRINEKCRLAMEAILNEAKRIDAVGDSKTFQACCRCFFQHPIILHFFSPFRRNKHVTENLITKETFLSACRTVSNLGNRVENVEFFAPFKNKLLNQLQDSIMKGKRHGNVDQNVITELLELLAPSKQEIAALLATLIKLEKNTFVSKENNCLSVYGFIFPKLLRMLCTDETDHINDLKEDFVTSIFSYIIFLKDNDKIDMSDWEDSVGVFLSSFSYYIPKIEPSLVVSLLKTKMHPSTVKLVGILCSKNAKFTSLFEKHSMKSKDTMQNYWVVFPIVSGNLQYKWSHEFLRKMNVLHKQTILSYFSDPQNHVSWIEENTKSVVYLIESTFDLETCQEISQMTSEIGDKLDLVSIRYIEILESLFQKFAALEKSVKNPLTVLVQILVRVTTQTLKKESRNTEKLSLLCEKLTKTVQKLREDINDFSFEALALKNNSWPQFTRFSLKLGLKKVTKDETDDSSLLRTLRELCEVAYKDESGDEYAKLMFEMATSHSEFVNIMLSDSVQKRELTGLLWTLVRKNKSVLSVSHVPLYLAAYNATLSQADQYILLILRFYETNSIRLADYRPYLFGNAAATHYSVKGDANTAIWRQPSTSQVLALFQPETIQRTIEHYPLRRDLAPRQSSESADVYDPAFYLPLLCHLLAENNLVACHRVMQSGALALVFASLCSECVNVRMMAYTILSRFHYHLEVTSSKDKLLWMRLVDGLRRGITELDKPLESVQLPCIVSTFLARTTLVFTQPLHPLYAPLHNFLTAKPALDLATIPELLQLFHSPEVEHTAHRHWILKVVRDGTRTELDLRVVTKCMLFKMLMDFYTSILSDEGTKKLILEVLNAALKIPNSCLLLVQNYGLLPWLSESVLRLNTRDSSTLELLVDIFENIVKNFANAKQNHNHYRVVLLRIVLKLKSVFSTNKNPNFFARYLNVLTTIASNKTVIGLVTDQELREILQLAKELLGNVHECENIVRFGCEHTQDSTEENSSRNNVERAKLCLKSFIITWRRLSK